MVIRCQRLPEGRNGPHREGSCVEERDIGSSTNRGVDVTILLDLTTLSDRLETLLGIKKDIMLHAVDLESPGQN